MVHRRQASDLDDVPRQLDISHFRPERHAHGDVVAWLANEFHGVTCGDCSWCDDAEVRSAVAVVGEGFQKTWFVNPACERGTGAAWDGDFQESVADGDLLVDQQRLQVKPSGREVFSEESVAEFSAELVFPVVELFAGEGVDGFVSPSVVLVIADGITSDTGTVAIMWAGNLEFNRGLWLLVDAGVCMPSTRISPTDGDVCGDDFHRFILACCWERGVGCGSGVARGGLGWNDAECLPLIAIDRTVRIINNYQGVNLKFLTLLPGHL